MFHTKAWLLWLCAALLPFTLTKNPFYLVPALLVVALDYGVLGRTSPMGKQWSTLLGLGITVALFSVLYNVLFVSVGATRLATLPALRLTFSGAVIQIGGAITFESLVYGLLQAASLIGILIAFATFNALADHYELLRSAPHFLYQSAIVLSIAITFVPQMTVAQAEIREAQALRGHRFRAVRDLLPLFVTLLSEGLEHSVTLAESMSARGFGSVPTGTKSATPLLQGLIAFGLFVLLCGTVSLTYFPDKTVSALLIVGGIGLLAIALWRIGARVQVSRYRRILWRRDDVVLGVISTFVILVLLGASFFAPASFLFYPYPRIALPAFEPIPIAAILLLAAPAVLAQLRSRD